jgi:hypothetical protein
MPVSREIRESLLERAHAELRTLDPEERPEERERLITLIGQLTEGILSPLVLEAVAASRRDLRR